MVLLLESILTTQVQEIVINDSFVDKVAGVSFMIIGLLFAFVAFIFILKKRHKLKEAALERKVEERSKEVYQQKKELEKRAKSLEKANFQITEQNDDILTKNEEIEKALEKLNITNQELTDLNREKDGMMSVVAHDLRTPLNNIQGLIQLLTLDGTLNEEQTNYVDTIKSVVARGNDMIRDLLDINAAKDPNRPMKKKEIDLLDFVTKWRSNFEKPLNEKNQQLIVEGNIENQTVMTDDGVLSRVLDNIMSNAMKFSEPGKSVYLKLKITKTKFGFILRDEGPGISQEDQKKMFKPFTKLSARPTSGEASNGLGLSIIKSLVERMGGTMTVKSEIGKGTAFQIALPRN
ncbi:MAG: ATP-binding protein [Reichenbachiella sp.]